MRCFFSCLSLASLLILPLQAWAAATLAASSPPSIKLLTIPHKETSGYLTVFFDNDLFGGTDQNYTNGVRLSFITEGKPALKIDFLQSFLQHLSGGEKSERLIDSLWGFDDLSAIEVSHGIALTQLMFTPTDYNALRAPHGQRPYAGWLGLGFSLHLRDEHIQNSVELTIGIVGSSSLAHEAQDFIHKVRGIYKFQGWDSQVPNELTLGLSFNQRRRWDKLCSKNKHSNFGIDAFSEVGGDIGNFMTAAHFGGMLRFGWNLPIEFSDSRLTSTSHAQKLYNRYDDNTSSWSLYGIMGFRAGVILYDITLDGPLFSSFDTGVTREPLVAEAYLGFGIRYREWEWGYVHTFRSKRFSSQEDEWQNFGSLTLRYHF